MLAIQGVVMAGAALLAGHFAPGWPVWAILAVAAVAGATASGYTGLAYAEYARLGGAQRTEATGLGSAAMFSGRAADAVARQRRRHDDRQLPRRLRRHRRAHDVRRGGTGVAGAE